MSAPASSISRSRATIGPPQRAVAGFDLPHDTPITGPWNVGDAVKEFANGGTTACAETAKLVVDKIVAAYPLAVR